MKKKIVIFGNSGSGKSTYSKHLASSGLNHLDLDTIAWDMNPYPVRKPIDESKELINKFTSKHSSWVVEGCYSDLLEIVATHANEMIYMNLDEEACIANAKNRPWEPHKYSSKKEQDKNLEMLINWIKQYSHRDDDFSKASHTRLYESFEGRKKMITSNQRL